MRQAKTWRRVHIPRDPAPSQWRSERCRLCGHKIESINGAYLRWRREMARLDQRTFGARAGLSGPYISDVENNRRACPVELEVLYRKLRKASL